MAPDRPSVGEVKYVCVSLKKRGTSAAVKASTLEKNSSHIRKNTTNPAVAELVKNVQALMVFPTYFPYK